MWIFGACFACFANGPLLANTAEATVLFSESQLTAVAQSVAIGDALRVEGVPLAGGASP